MAEATGQVFAFVWFLLIVLALIMTVATICSAVLIILTSIKNWIKNGKN